MMDAHEGKIVGGTVIFEAPKLTGIKAEVQHGLASGRGFTEQPGDVGVGVIVLPTGQPRLLMQVRHADGTSLAVALKKSELVTLRSILDEADREADAIGAAAAATTRQ